MEPNLSEYITEYWAIQNRLNSNYDEIWSGKEDQAWEDRCYE